MNTTITPMLGRQLTDNDLAAFHGGYCDITVSRGADGKVQVSQRGPSCGNVSIQVIIQA